MNYYQVKITSIIPENSQDTLDIEKYGECECTLYFRSREPLKTTVPIRKVCQTLPGFKRLVQVLASKHFLLVNQDRWNRLGNNKKFTIS